MNITRLIIGGILAVLTLIFVGNLWYTHKKSNADLIAQEVDHLASIFQKIDQSCTITGTDHPIIPINFLNVGSFSGSEVGSMNLKYPNNWRGPYVKENPTIQSIEYQLVRTKDGYFVTPGNGVKLPNGKIVGKDIVLHEDTDIESLMHDDNALSYKGKVFAAHVALQGISANYWAKVIEES